MIGKIARGIRILNRGNLIVLDDDYEFLFLNVRIMSFFKKPESKLHIRTAINLFGHLGGSKEEMTEEQMDDLFEKQVMMIQPKAIDGKYPWRMEKMVELEMITTEQRDKFMTMLGASDEEICDLAALTLEGLYEKLRRRERGEKDTDSSSGVCGGDRDDVREETRQEKEEAV